jgi:predicted TIM-barrel fold metal-dependent hydrolase
VPEAGVVERAVELLGPRRVLFASDCLFAESVGRVESAELPEEHKRMIYYGNAREVFGE